MFDNETRGTISSNWTTSSRLNFKEVGAMNHIEKVLFDALNGYNFENNIEERTYRYYFFRNCKDLSFPNQVLHLDSMNPDYDDPYNELIVHIPLEQEGQ